MTARDKPDLERAGAFLEGLLGEEEQRRVEKLDDEAIAVELREAGVKRVPTVEELVAKAAARGAKRSAPARIRRRSRLWLLAAAVLAVVVILMAYKNRGAIEALWKGEPIRPEDPWLPWKRAPTDEERAAKLREDALAACAVRQWAKCQAGLDEARDLWGAGELDPRVTEARRAIEAAAHDAGGDASEKKVVP